MLWTSASSRRRENNGRSTKCCAFRPRLEALEDRLAPVIGAYAPNPVPPGFVTVDHVALDGVVQLGLSKPGDDGICTGALLQSQRHILTAAHCVTDDNGQLDVTQVTVTFTFSDWSSKPVVYTVMPNAITVHPGWTGDIDNGNDIAILTLPSLAPSGPVGLGARGYLLYTDFDEVGKQFEFAGFGQTGGGDTGGMPGTAGTGKRLGYNRFDTRTKPVPFIGSDTGLAFDFDDGSVFNNTLVLWGSPKTPVKDGDSMIGKGDSGGPSFLKGLLAGVTSGTYAVNDFDPDGTFGDIGVVERVSLHRKWINDYESARHQLVINLAEQRPVDGARDTIKLLREGNNVAFYINDQFYYFEPLSQISTITINGSSDNEDFHIDSDLNKSVTFDGGGGTNRLFVRNSTSDLICDVDETTISCTKSLVSFQRTVISPQNVSSIELAGDSGDTVRVTAVRSGTPVTVVGAGTVEIGGVLGGNLSAIKDLVTVNGSSTLLNINDATWANRRDYDVYSDHLMVDLFGVATTIKYQGLSILNIWGGGAGNVFSVFDTPALIVRLYSGAGADLTKVLATSLGTLAIEGQGGGDTVTVGLGRSMQNILGVLRIHDVGGSSTINLENQADSTRRDVTMEDTSGGNVTISGLAPGKIRVDRDAVRALNIWAGDGSNGFTIHNTPNSNGSAGALGTTIHTGNGHDLVNVYGTRGPLALDGQLGTNQVFVGSPTAGLDKINGAVSFRSPGANYLTVDDFAATTGHDYILDRNAVQRTDRAAITFQDLSSLFFTAGASAETDTITIRDTAPNILTDVSYGGGNDVMTVERTAPGLVVLRAGAATQIEVGTGTSSLDNIQSLVRVVCSPDNLVTLRLNDTAATTPSALLVSGTDSGQRYQRAIGASFEWRTLVEVLFSPLIGAPVENFEYYAGSGGSTAYVDSTTAGTTSSFYGHAGAWDIFALGFGTDMNQILGNIFVAGQAADNDFAYYYDFLNPNPQSYDVGALFSTMYIQRPGIGIAAFVGLQQIIFYAPRVGGNVENVRYVTPGTGLGMVVNSDVVTIGTSAPNLGGSLAGIQGHVVVSGYADANVRLIVDNSGNPTTGYQGVSLFRRQGPYDSGNHIHGFAPAEILWNFGGASTVDLRGGAADEFFTVQNGLLNQISIDGGTGYSLLQSEGGVPAKFTFTGHNAGRLYDNVHFTGIQSFYGTDADDQFDFLGGAAIDGGIDGFGGTNTLDYSGTQGAAGQVSRYRADGNALDAVGDNHGTLVNGATFVPGRFGQAFQFSGYDNPGYVRVPSTPGLEPTTVSVEAWVNSTYLTAPGAYGYILSKGAADFRGASYALVTSNNSGLWFYVGNGSAFQYSPDPGSDIWDGDWHHVVGTYDGSYVRLYVDGVEVGNGTPLANALGYGLPTTNDLFIGTYNGLPGYTFNGRIDEVSVFNRALSAAEVQARFDAAVAGEPSSGPGVYVNLQTGQATGVAGAITHIQNVIGSSGDDILVGNGGNVLFGGAGRDLLIGGALASQLYGGGDEDILIGGTLNDSSRANLDAIMAEWTRTGDGNDYASRVARLRAGLLADGTITGNGGGNTLTGEGGLDLFFGSFVTDWQVDDGEWVFPL